MEYSVVTVFTHLCEIHVNTLLSLDGQLVLFLIVHTCAT
jgi:hypothetical protein